MDNKGSRVGVLMALMLSVSIVAPALADPINDELLLDQFVEASGLDRQIRQIPQAYMGLMDQVFLGLERSRHPLPKRVQQNIRQRFIDALAPDRLEPAIRSALSRELTLETMLPALSWLHSDLGKKITELEIAAGAADQSIEMGTFMLQLQLERPSPERLQLVRRFEEVTQGSQMATDALEAVVLAVAGAVSAEFRGAPLDGGAKLQDELAALRSKFKGLFLQGRIVQTLYTYRSLTDPELVKYVEFMDSTTGRQIVTILNRSVQGAALDALHEIPSLQNFLKQKEETA